MEEIDEEIFVFNDKFFEEFLYVIDDGLSFIEDNKLYCPKENYLTIFEFLNTTIRNFHIIDHRLVSGTLKKLYLDVKFLYSFYQKNKYGINDIEEIFLEKFLKKSLVFDDIMQEILRLNNITDKTNDEKLSLRELINDFKELKVIYFKEFQEIFQEDIKNNTAFLLKILNSKLYYLDKILWIKISSLHVIKKHLDTLGLKARINSKDYIVYKLKDTIPNSMEHDYLQKCLRVYK